MKFTDRSIPLPLQLLEMTFSCKEVGPFTWEFFAIVRSRTAFYYGVYAQKKLKFLTSFYSRTALFCDITQRVVVISCRRFGTSYWSHLWGLRILECWNFRPLKMASIGCPETSVRNYHYSLHNNPKQPGSNLLRCGILKSFLLPVHNWCVTIARARIKPKTHVLKAKVSKIRFLR
jgi:hypothetical protein